jgi:hypothetical protein
LKDFRLPGQQIVQSTATSDVQVSENVLESLRVSTAGRGMLVSTVVWDMIDNAQEMIEVANELVAHGEYPRAAAHYHNLIFFPILEMLMQGSRWCF